jgi:hypothetical protein
MWSPIWGPRPDVCYCPTASGVLTWGALSDERTGRSFTIAADPRQRRNFWVSESRRTHGHIVLSQIRDSINLEGQVPVFISPWSRVAQLYSQALGSLFVASFTDWAENTASNSFSIVVWAHCLAMALVLLCAYKAVAQRRASLLVSQFLLRANMPQWEKQLLPTELSVFFI